VSFCVQVKPEDKDPPTFPQTQLALPTDPEYASAQRKFQNMEPTASINNMNITNEITNMELLIRKYDLKKINSDDLVKLRNYKTFFEDLKKLQKYQDFFEKMN
jgi:hypothetical protein